MCQRAHLLPSGPPDAEGSILYRAQTADCRPCPLRASCVGASRGAKALWASTYRLELERAGRINQTVRYAREQRRRQTVIEGVFAHLDQLGGREPTCGGWSGSIGGTRCWRLPITSSKR